MKLRPALTVSLVLALALVAAARAARQDEDSVTEISLEMTQIEYLDGKKFGRELKVILRRDGAALFEGKANVKLLGKYKGSVPAADFERLAEFLKSRKYSKIHESLPEYWVTPPAGTFVASPPSPVVVTSVESGGRRKVVVRETMAEGSNRRKPPKEIFEIEQAIMDAAMRIKWAKSE
jgi:hypothetical protein